MLIDTPGDIIPWFQRRIRPAIQMMIQAKNPMQIEPAVISLYPVFTSMPLIRVTTQKKLSLAWEATIDPAPIARTERARPIDESSLMDASMGARIEAVVMIATVEDP
jgi:hypothetical protein